MDFDYVVVGAGSAGCAVASRLSENPANRVALIEAGGRDWNPWIHIPVGYFTTLNNPATDWCLKTEPDEGLAGRSINWPRGKVLGGSSAINGLLYVRGQPQDYDHWRQLGNKGWGWDDVLPLFIKSEDHERGADDVHGSGGPLAVSDARLSRAICNDWVEAAVAAGYPHNADYNDGHQEGVGFYQLTSRKGWRCSSATAFLKPARRRPNLKIITGALALGLEFDGPRASGVRIHRHGRNETIKARGEVVLAAGAIGSPHLLMLSGIGDPQELHTHGIDLRHAISEVGKNLQDHLQARLIFKCNERTMNDEVRSLWRKMAMALEFALYRTGPMTMAASLAFGFMKTRPEVATPDIQFHVQPWSADSPAEGVHPFSAFTMSVCQLRPESTGQLKLRSSSPMDTPAIHPNYLATPTDQETLVAGIRMAREIAGYEPLRSKISDEFQPGRHAASDADLLQWARQTSTTIYHPAGTCRMGNDNNAVVDDRLRVKGIEGLRVADCSIMPQIVSGNTNAPAIMIGEKAALMIQEDGR